jgi:hypothetical protein
VLVLRGGLRQVVVFGIVVGVVVLIVVAVNIAVHEAHA